MELESVALLRIAFSVGGLIFFLTLGFLFPFRKSPHLKNRTRLLTNIFISFSNGFLIYLLVPVTLVGISNFAQVNNIGILNQFAAMNVFKIILAVIFLDLIIYWQHRLTHKIPVLWLLHRVHHTDIEFDTSTAGRFHILEILFSFMVKALFVIILGLPAISIIIFEIILNVSSLFNHGNFTLSPQLEKLLRAILVTPDMHRIHHSILKEETDSNYSFCISIWDRLFGSYLASSKTPPQTMDIGIEQFRNVSKQNYFYILKIPFAKDS